MSCRRCWSKKPPSLTQDARDCRSDPLAQSETFSQGSMKQVTVSGSSERVEFAKLLQFWRVREHRLASIDSKFPGDTYEHLVDAIPTLVMKRLLSC